MKTFLSLQLALAATTTQAHKPSDSYLALSVDGAALRGQWDIASVLADLGLPQGALLLALVGFNLGVETGQLAIVAAFLPVAYLLRRSVFYRRVVFTGGSAAIALVALVWLAERALDVKLWP